MAIKFEGSGSKREKKAPKADSVDEGVVVPIEPAPSRGDPGSLDVEGVGKALYGSQWVSELSHDLRVSRATIYRWVETGELPDKHRGRLLELVRDRIGSLEALLGDE